MHRVPAKREKKERKKREKNEKKERKKREKEKKEKKKTKKRKKTKTVPIASPCTVSLQPRHTTIDVFKDCSIKKFKGLNII